MSHATTQKSNSTTAIIFAVFAVVCIVAFLSYRSNDIGQLPKLIGNLGGGALFGSTIIDGVISLAVALAIYSTWSCTGGFALRYISSDSSSHFLIYLILRAAIGAAIWSLIWFIFGLVGLYSGIVAVFSCLIGISVGLLAQWPKQPSDKFLAHHKFFALSISIPVLLALIASLSPPIAKDALLYHFAVPNAFITQQSNAFIDGNIASYLALGTEMQSVWAMLLGNYFSMRAGEAAAGATVFLFFPLLLITVYGWTREVSVSRTWSLIATAMVACIPTAYHVASSGYIDLSLALYITLAAYGLTRWWKEQTWGWVILIGIFLGAALSVKLTTVFVFAAFALIILLRARESKDTQPGSLRSGKIVATGFAALFIAGVIASPWYIRTWVATGSPVFPFYMSIWPGKATGWDVERSNLFQGMNSQYGGVDIDKINYLTAPVRLSVAAQPEQPANYDGVLGVAFLMGLLILVFGWTKDLGKYGSITFFLFVWVNLIFIFQLISGMQYVPIISGSLIAFVVLSVIAARNSKQEFLNADFKIILGVAAIMYLFWLFSSEQLRYLLPIAPLLVIAIAASAEKIGNGVSKVARISLVAASVCGLLTTFAWFCQKAPLRVVLGGETRDEYLMRNLDYYPYYQWINTETPPDEKVWLINMRRDTYHIERPIFSDYLFEDWTLRKMIWEAGSAQEMRAKSAAMGIKYVLTRHDFLFDYDRSTLVDDKKPRAENESKIKIAKEFILDPANTIKADNKFSLIKVF